MNCRTEGRTSRLVWALIGLLALGHAGLAFDCARHMSVTADEYWHLPVGLLSLKTGLFHFDPLNPPLIRTWAAVPLLFTSASVDATQTDLYALGDTFLAANAQHYDWLFLLGRCMVILLSVATGLSLALWARQMFGPAAACLTALLWFTDPTVIAHGSLVTTDMGVTLFFVLTLFALWRFARGPNWKWALAFGVLLGLAQLTKYTALLLYPLSVLLWLVLRLRAQNAAKRSVKSIVIQWAAALAISLGVLNAGYLFRGSCSSFGAYQFQCQTLKQLSEDCPWLRALPVLLPYDYVVGIDRQRHVMEGTHPVYLEAEWKNSPFPHYYVMALIYKLPHATHALMLLSVVFLLRSLQEPRRDRLQLFLGLPVLLLLMLGGGMGMQLGIRYVLPIFPLLTLFASQSVCWLKWSRYRLRSCLILAAVAATPLALRHHPHHLAYFNELAGGPLNGRWHLLDSNLDWGQDLRELKRFLDEQSLGHVGLAYFGTAPPASLGIQYHVPPPFPTLGWHAVSVNFVFGRPHTVRTMQGETHSLGLNALGYFRFFEPISHVGYSIDVFHLTEADLTRWRAFNASNSGRQGDWRPQR